MFLLDIKYSPSLTGQNKTKQNIFCQVEFVDKSNLEAQNPRRDNSIPSISAGLPWMSSLTVQVVQCCMSDMVKYIFHL